MGVCILKCYEGASSSTQKALASSMITLSIVGSVSHISDQTKIMTESLYCDHGTTAR